jgi:hypothetical protein
LKAASIFLLFLVAVHLLLAGWAIVGLIEWFNPNVPWRRLSNPMLPAGVLLLHWILMLLAGGIFLGGYAVRWSGTSVALALAYVCLAALCAVETLGFLVSRTRFLDMAVEYAAYMVIVIFLFRATSAREHFNAI